MDDERMPFDGTAYRAQLRRAVEDDFDALVGHVRTGLLEELPGYRTIADDLDGALKPGARLVLDSVFGEEQRASAQPIWRIVGAQRARAGVRREAVASAANVVLYRAFEFLLAASTRIAAPGPLATAVVQDIWARLRGETTQIGEAVLAGYDEQRSLGLSAGTRPKAVLIDRLLSSQWEEPDEILEEARRLGADLTRPHGALVLVSHHDSPAELAAGAGELARLVPEALEGPCRPWTRPHVVIVVPAQPVSPWRKAVQRCAGVATKHRLAVVVVEPVDPVALLEARYERVMEALRAVEGVVLQAGTVTAFDLDYCWTLSRASIAERIDVVRRTLGPVLDAPNAPRLLDVLDALYQTREGVGGAAQALAIHENTVRTRRHRIAELTNLSLDVPADAHRLFTARLHHRLLLASGTWPADPQDAV